MLVKVDDFSNKICQPRRSRRIRNTHLETTASALRARTDAADVGGMLRALTRPTCMYIVGALTASGWGIMVGHQRCEPRDRVTRNI